MAKLADTPSVLLAHAAKQNNSIYPLPEMLTKHGAPVARTTTSLDQLIRRGLVAEYETDMPSAICRTDGDLSYGLFVTIAGLTAIGIDDEGVAAAATQAPAPAPVPRPTKGNLVLGLIRREGGATLPELIAATGWLPHTTRAVLTGLRKKGHVIGKTKRDRVTCYSVTVEA